MKIRIKANGFMSQETFTKKHSYVYTLHGADGEKLIGGLMTTDPSVPVESAIQQILEKFMFKKHPTRDRVQWDSELDSLDPSGGFLVTGTYDRKPIKTELRDQTKTTWNDDKAESLYQLLVGLTRTDRKKYTLKIFCKYAYEQKDSLPSWVKERIYFMDNDAHYCAGQDYPAEIAHIRKLIVG